MIPRRFAAALAGIALIAGLSGCATPALDQAAATQFQESVVAIADSAAAGDLTGAVAGLDELQTELNAAIDADLVTAARAVRIQAAIDVVRSDLEVLQAAPAPVESPAPVEATDTGEVPAGTGGGENDNSGPGNNNGNGNGNSGAGNNSGPGNGNGNGNGNGKKSR